MIVTIGHLGPSGTYAEMAAVQYANWLTLTTGQETRLAPFASIAKTLRAVAQGVVDVAVVPVENSIEGSVTVTLDTLWQLDKLQIQRELVLPIVHGLLSHAATIDTIRTVYSHPQALAQCQIWLEKNLPLAQLVSANSTTEALQRLANEPTVGAIASSRAAELYDLPILACPINDYPDNCTRFWALGLQPSPGGPRTSVAFTVHDVPGALLKPLQVFADQGINLSKIESRPTKRSLGDYLFFVDLEGSTDNPHVQSTLAEVVHHTATLKVFGSYDISPLQQTNAAADMHSKIEE